jgi:hypothetical protein
MSGLPAGSASAALQTVSAGHVAAALPYSLLDAILLVVAITLLLAAIEVPSSAKAGFSACFNWSSFIYFVILAIGHVAATFLAGNLVGTTLPGSPLFWHAFFGIFGFQTVMKHTNITVFDKGVLSIEEWTRKALDNAVVASQGRYAESTMNAEFETAEQLNKIDEQRLNAYIEQYLGTGKAVELQRAAEASGSAPKYYKAWALAQAKPRQAAAIIRTLKKAAATPAGS